MLAQSITSNNANRNALLVNLYLYIYGLTLPFNYLLGGNYLIMLCTLLMLLYSILKGVKRFHFSLLVLFLVPFTFLLIKVPFEFNTDGGDVVYEMLISLFTIGVSGILIGCLKFSYESFIRYGLVVGWFNFLLIFYIPFTSAYNVDISYMKFGYTILPTVVFSFIYLTLYSNNRMSTLFIFIISLGELLFFGARGASLTFVVFVIFYVFIFLCNKM